MLSRLRKQRRSGDGLRLAGLSVVAGLFAMFNVPYAIAEELHPGHDWLKNKRNANGTSCCNGKDCHPIDDAEINELDDGSVEARGLKFPRSKVLPTEDGQSYICHNGPVPYCLFMKFGA